MATRSPVSRSLAARLVASLFRNGRALTVLGLVAALAGCTGGSTGTAGSPRVPPSGADNNSVVVTPSISGTVATAVGGSQALALTFTSSDGKSLTALSVTSDLASLPAGWTGPSTFTCDSVTTGNGCVLNLAFRPTAASAGTLALTIQYTTNAGQPGTKTVSVPFQADAVNHVTGAVSPAGPLNVPIGSSQGVTVTFTSDDAASATQFELTTSLAALPARWSSTAATLACASVSTGNGCQLPLTFAPTASDNGTLVLGYRYVNKAGLPATGSVAVAYTTFSQESVQAAFSPAGSVAAFVGTGSQVVHVAFGLIGGTQASLLQVTTALTALPAGWTAATPSFSCPTVTASGGCTLDLTFAPTVAGTGTLSLAYAYVDDVGAARQGSVAIPYVGTNHSNVVGMTSVIGTVTGFVSGSQNLTVHFISDNGLPTTNFSITSGLASLPSGWTASSPSLTCSAVSTGSGCQVGLTFAPSAPGSGSIQLGYQYTDNAGTVRSGTVTIPYLAQTVNSVVTAVSPSGQVVVAPGAGPRSVTITFTTNDGTPATGLFIADTSFHAPTWSYGSSPTTCATVTTGTGCQVTLTYTPTAADRGVLTLMFGYHDNSNNLRTQYVSIPYATAIQHLYVVEPGDGIYVCALDSYGSLSGCALTGNLPFAQTLVFNGSTAYVADPVDNVLWTCTVNADATLSACADSGVTVFEPEAVTVQNGFLYIANGILSPPTPPAVAPAVTKCVIQGGGALGPCTDQPGAGSRGLTGIAFNAGYAYTIAAGLQACAVNGSGDLTSCQATGLTSLGSVMAQSGTIYGTDGVYSQVVACQSGTNGAPAQCIASAVGNVPRSVAVTSTQAFVGDDTGSVTVCGLIWAAPIVGGMGPCAAVDGGQGKVSISDVVLH